MDRSPHAILIPIAIAATLALLVASTIAARQIVLRLHADSLGEVPRTLSRTRAVLRIGAGLALVTSGVALLVLPGQGMLLIALGLLMCAPAWRRRLVRSMMARPRILLGINAYRRRHGRTDVVLPASSAAARPGTPART